MHRRAPGENLPASHDDIGIGRAELDPVADAAGHFGRDQTRAGAQKRVVDLLAGPTVVDDRAAHAFDRLLSAVPTALLALRVTERIVVWKLPDRSLGAVTAPMAALALAHSVPAGYVLPMIVATAQGEVLLGPDDLSARPQPASREIGDDDVAVQSSVPGIGDIPGEQRIRLPPVGAVVVEHLALRQLAGTEAAARSPGRIVADAIRRIGDHQMRPRSRQHWRDIRRARAVAAADPVVSQQPYVAEPSDRLFGYFRDAVRIGQTARTQTGQYVFEPIRLEADQVEIETGKLELAEFVA